MSGSRSTPQSAPPQAAAAAPTTPALSEAEATERLAELWADPPGFIGWFRSLQNDAVGGRIMVTAFTFFLIGGLLALLMRTQLIQADNDLVGADRYNELFTMHGSTMMYLFVVPMLEGFAIFLLPLLLGNREMPFPRLGVFSYFTFVMGGLLFYASYLFNAVPNTGWFAYVPLSGPEFSPGRALDFWLLALGVAEVAAIAAGVEIVITILRMRAPGMTLARMPVLAWALLVTAFSILFAFTPLFVATMLLELDRKFNTQFFDPSAGGSPILWQHLFWIFGHPEVYIQFIPAIGMISMIIPVFVRHRLVGYSYIVMAILATGFISFALWVHHMFTVGLPQIAMLFFSVASILIGIPAGVQIFAWIATIWSGRPIWKTPFLFAVGFIVIFVLGGITGIMVGSIPFDWQAHDSYFVVAHLHYVLIGGSVFPIFAALYYWIPKIHGKLLSERLGKWNFWLMFIGTHVTFFPQHIVGLLGMPRRIYTYPAAFGWDIYNLISTLGSYLLGLGVLLFVVNYFYSLYWGEDAPDNPWQADSLEWATTSPPPNYGFADLPVVRSRHPLWDQASIYPRDDRMARLMDALSHYPLNWRGALTTSAIDAQPQEVFRVAGPSIWPFITALGIITIFGAEIFSLRIAVITGALLLIGGLIGWHWPVDKVPTTDAELAFERAHGIPVRPNGSRIVANWAMNLLILLIAIALSCLLFSYFYIRIESPAWPPAGIARPAFWWPLLSTLLYLASGGVLWWARRGIQQDRQGQLRVGLAGGFLLGLAAVGLLIYACWGLPFTHETHAYGSLFYALHGFLLAVVVGGLLQNALTQIWSWQGNYTARDYVAIDVGVRYWWATILYWLLSMGTVYGAPYLM
ncbi:MAG: cytochrome c oxidase subunit I [Caldilineaceae bacterium]|nr:cytochrome c oxidase subunit I [Caldilineaceae bacterium]